MRSLARAVLVASLCAIAPPPGIDGQTVDIRYRQYLVPLTARNAAGSNGSVWTSDLTAYNSKPVELKILVRACEPFIFLTPPCYGSIPLAIGPGGEEVRIPEGSEPTIIHVPEELAEEVDFELRVRDLSRAADSWGTEIPVVPVNDFRRTIRLLDVPVDPRYRINLRIYGHDGRRRTVTVTTYPFPGTTAIDHRVVELRSPFEAMEDIEHPLTPAHTQLDAISAAVLAAGSSRLRIDVESLSEEPLWAFASITNNVTQRGCRDHAT